MDDIFTKVREGNAFHVRVWLDNTENDLNQGDDHRFSLLHWAAREGKNSIVDMLIQRGARINATNMGDDTALHLAASHGHRDIVLMVSKFKAFADDKINITVYHRLQNLVPAESTQKVVMARSGLLHNKANINAINEHGNTPLHYACFWGHDQIAEDLVNNGAQVLIANKYDETPLDKAKPYLAKMMTERAASLGQDLQKIPYKDRSWLGYKTRSRDALLSRHQGIDISQVNFNNHMITTHSGKVWRGSWQGNDIVAKILNLRDCSVRNSRDFQEEFPRLRIFNHQNILPVLACCNQPPNLVVISQFMPYGSLFNVLHGETGIVVDQNQALRFAIDIARGMEFLHTMEPLIPNLILTSKHVMIDEDLAKINIDDPKYRAPDGTITGIDEDLTARINMADYKFSFHEKGKLFSPAWMAPEALQKKPEEMNQKSADMWSFAILLFELETREVPFADLTSMEIGMKVALEGLRISIPPGISTHILRLLKICMNEDPGKRPRFDMIIPILEKMKQAS